MTSWAKASNVRQAFSQYDHEFDASLIDQLSPLEQIELLGHLEKLVGGERLEDWIARCFPAEPPPRHTLPIIEVMEQARVTPIRLCISVGPGHAKTTTLLRSIVWWMGRTRDQCAYTTYSAGQAQSKSRIAQDFAITAGYQLTSESVGHWGIDGGGQLLATGLRGKLTGQRIPGLFIVDDPYKDEGEARSATVNTAVKERFKAVAFTRLQGGSIIVLHTRWAEDDLIGFIERELKWDSINISTQCDSVPDVLGRRIGEAAWPEKYPYEICTEPCGHDGHLLEIRKTIGEHLWASMYQGRPRPLGTAVFHEPARYRLYPDPQTRAPSDFTWEGKRGAIVIDPAATAKTSADWSVLLVCAMEGLGHEAKMWIVDCVRVQCEIPTLVKKARELQIKYKLTIACEAIGGFKAVPQMLRSIDKNLRVIDITVGSRDKLTRALPVAAAWNDGRVLVPIDTGWAGEFINEHQRFTGQGDRHDDQVDGDAHAWNVLYRPAKRWSQDDYAQDSAI